ncbi:GH32 C-terminal domain-containing protein [Psychromicrobium sp. YIM B11713]|uniref:GH32 C-terminal domain-containing protein n=1 Tax=Psychromicrobium sp. YIM B11713 TaxID=3145233 RepID=UPI00374E522C
MSRKRTFLNYLTVTTVALTMTFGVNVSVAQAASPNVGDEPYRQHLHYSPAKNWVNDPNGMLYYKGTYHMFYQHNPQGDQWGNMSWGHATSTDLLNWKEQPVAIPNTANEFIYSGSAVIDWNNTTGFGTRENPPMVAIYTSAYQNDPVHGNRQAQSLAYSLDEGKTWTKYSGNPVNDRGRNDYRDPKVFWYGDQSTGYWVMAAVEADASRVILNRSSDLKTWTYMSTFTSNTVGGFWECPDLYPIKLDGNDSRTKWVIALSTSASQQSYIVGDFDGSSFKEDPAQPVAVPPNAPLWDFESGNYQGWKVTNDQVSPAGGPFGTAPATGALPQQQAVSGFAGRGLVNSYLGTDSAVGSLVSPNFVINSSYLSFLLGGGNHPREAGTGSGLAPEGSRTIFDFETPAGKTLADEGWTGTGGLNPASQPASPHQGENVAWGYGGKGFLSTFYTPEGSDAVTGSLTSPAFTIDSPYIDLKVGGGDGPDLAVQLLVDGAVVKSETGKRDHLTDWRSWDVTAYQGKRAQLKVVDNRTDFWGAIWIDDVVASTTPALPRSTETSVNLVIDGQTVLSTTGPNSETMNWANWNVSQYRGRTAHLEIIDNNRGGYGHIMADHFVTGDKPVPPTIHYDTHRLDFGTDNYAANTYNAAPDGKRIFVGWMGQAFSSPTSPWRGSFTMPRELNLKTVNGVPTLVQSFASQLSSYEKTFAAYNAASTTVTGAVSLPETASGTQQRIRFSLTPGAGKSGIVVRSSATEGTKIGFDPATSSVFIDRSKSGLIPSDRFNTPSSTPVRVINGKVSFDILIDTSSVEVLVNGGEQAFTEFIYPSESSNKVSLFSDSGSSTVTSLSVVPMYSSVYDDGQVRLTVPGAPTAAAATASGSSAARVSWKAPVDTGNTALTGYTAVARIAGKSKPVGSCQAPGNKTSCTVNGLSTGSSYVFSVSAQNIVGKGAESTPSKPLRIRGGHDCSGYPGSPWHGAWRGFCCPD